MPRKFVTLGIFSIVLIAFMNEAKWGLRDYASIAKQRSLSECVNATERVNDFYFLLTISKCVYMISIKAANTFCVIQQRRVSHQGTTLFGDTISIK